MCTKIWNLKYAQKITSKNATFVDWIFWHCANLSHFILSQKKKKRFVSHPFARKTKCFFFKENEQFEIWEFFIYCAFGPLFFFFFFAASSQFFSFFSWQLKKKRQKIGLGEQGYVAKVSPHTDACGFVRQTLFFFLAWNL